MVALSRFSSLVEMRNYKFQILLKTGQIFPAFSKILGKTDVGQVALPPVVSVTESNEKLQISKPFENGSNFPGIFENSRHGRQSVAWLVATPRPYHSGARLANRSVAWLRFGWEMEVIPSEPSSWPVVTPNETAETLNEL